MPLTREGRHNQAVAGQKCVPITDEYDVILLCTNHEVYKTYDFKSLGVPLVDCRNASNYRPENFYAA